MRLHILKHRIDELHIVDQTRMVYVGTFTHCNTEEVMMYVDRNELYRVLTRKYHGVQRDDVHEAVQHAVVVAYEACIMREPPQNIQAYVTTVASRALARSKAYGRKFVHPERDTFDGWSLLEEDSSILRATEDHATTVDAGRVISAMPEHYAAVLRKHYIEGLPFEEIARQIGVTAECIRKRHERALKYARKLFT